MIESLLHVIFNLQIYFTKQCQILALKNLFDNKKIGLHIQTVHSQIMACMFLHVCIQYAYFFSNQLVHCNFIISNLNSCLNLWKNTTEYCRFSTHLNIKEHSNYRTILEPISLTFFLNLRFTMLKTDRLLQVHKISLAFNFVASSVLISLSRYIMVNH